MSIKLKDEFQAIILESTGASSLTHRETIQNLWSGYGKIMRYYLSGSLLGSVVVKHVRFPNEKNHPRGWNSDLSHQRKLHSYEVEVEWYRNWSRQCGDGCHVPQCLALEAHEDEVIMVLEDLDAMGFPLRKTSVSWVEMTACLTWLANFHATFLGQQPIGLWEIGTYWHLNTRPEELEALNDDPLKKGASQIDLLLQQSPFQTLVHGDAKLANFCFSNNGREVSAVDFQYVGGGCGMKDIAYFIGSCLYEDECKSMEDKILDYYFKELEMALYTLQKDVNFYELEQNWRDLFPVAWTDFHRFLKGWSPGHWKINGYSERIAQQVLSQIRS